MKILRLHVPSIVPIFFFIFLALFIFLFSGSPSRPLHFSGVAAAISFPSASPPSSPLNDLVDFLDLLLLRLLDLHLRHSNRIPVLVVLEIRRSVTAESKGCLTSRTSPIGSRLKVRKFSGNKCHFRPSSYHQKKRFLTQNQKFRAVLMKKSHIHVYISLHYISLDFILILQQVW